MSILLAWSNWIGLINRLLRYCIDLAPWSLLVRNQINAKLNVNHDFHFSCFKAFFTASVKLLLDFSQIGKHISLAGAEKKGIPSDGVSWSEWRGFQLLK